MFRGRYGLFLSAISSRAAVCYVEGVDRLPSLWVGARGCIEQAVMADTDFALAHAT